MILPKPIRRVADGLSVGGVVVGVGVALEEVKKRGRQGQGEVVYSLTLTLSHREGIIYIIFKNSRKARLSCGVKLTPN